MALDLGAQSPLESSAFLHSPSLPRGLAYWSSDASGFRGEARASAQAEPWILGLEPGFAAGSGERILFHDGQEVVRTIAVTQGGLRTDSLYRSGILASVQAFDSHGALMEESLFDPPLPGETRPQFKARTLWTYEKGRLIKAEAFDAGGAASGALSYSYDALGRLQEVRASGSMGTSASGIVVAAKGLSTSWLDEELTRYDEVGRPREILGYNQGKLIKRSLLAYDGQGRLVSKTSEDLPNQGLTKTSYDGMGHPLLEIEQRGGKEISRRTYSWDGGGRALREFLQAGGKTVETSWVYGEGTDLWRSTRKVDGILDLVVHEQEGGLVVKEVYDAGVMVLRLSLRQAHLVKEEFILADGSIRTKDYP